MPPCYGYWKITTFVGALRLHGMTATRVLDGPKNGPAFLAYVAVPVDALLLCKDGLVVTGLLARSVA